MATASVRAFRGNPYVTIASITPGTIASSRTSCAGVPAFFHLSASAVTASGTSQPYEDLEYRWSVTTGAEGYHTFALTWLTQIVSGTTQSTTKNSETDQVGPEAVFRFYEAGTKVVTLTIRGADGAGGYITATQTITLTVTANSAANHFFYDPDAGNNANDGKDPWGFGITGGVLSGASVTAGLYTISSKASDDVLVIDAGSGDLRTLTKTGAFASYNHTTATAPTDILARYNVIGITNGTAASISTSNGPKATSSATELASDTVLHFKGGNTITHTLPTNTQFRSKSNYRLINYGASLAYRSTGLYFAEGAGQAFSNVCFSGFDFNGGDATGGGGGFIQHFASGTGLQSTDFYMNRCTLRDFNDLMLINWDYFDGPFGLWDCTLSNPLGATNKHCVYSHTKRWASFVGGSMAGLGHSTSLDHHIYPSIEVGNMVFKWINFGTGTTRNYCINTNSHSPLGTPTEGILISECNITGTIRAWDAGKSAGTDGVHHNFVAEGNVIHGMNADGHVYFSECTSMTIRDCLFYDGAGGRYVAPATSTTTLDFKVYYNRFYCSMAASDRILEVPKEITTAPTIKNNTFHDTRTTNNIVLGVDFTNASKVAGNGLYTPNNAGNVARDMQGAGTNKTYAQYAAIDATAQQTNPYWTDGSTGDFSIPVPTSLAGVASTGHLALTWANPTGAVRNRVGYGTSSGVYTTLDIAATTSRTITAAGELIYAAVNQTDPYGWESAFCGEISKHMPSSSQVLRVRTAAGIYTFGVG